MKHVIAALLLCSVALSSCRDESEGKMFWYNSRSDTLHNKSCKYYGDTRGGYYTDAPLGRDCGFCGGAGASYRDNWEYEHNH